MIGILKFKISDLLTKNEIFDKTIGKLIANLVKYSSIALVFSSIFLLSSLIIKIFFYPSLVLLIFSFLIVIYSFILDPYKFTYAPIFRIKVFDSKSGERPGSIELIHSKIYVIDDEIAFIGSANFTYSGFKTHYETVVKIVDKNAVFDISNEVENLYNSNELRSKSVEEWMI